MSRGPAKITQADVGRVIRAAKKEGATEVEVRIGDQTMFVIRLGTANTQAPPLEQKGEVVL